MKTTPTLWISAALLACLVVAPGCGGSKEPVAKGDTPSATTETAPAPAEPGAPTPVALSELPDALKTDAYEYYGLGNTKPMDLERTVAGQADVVTGSQRFWLKEVKDGKATFVVERTGGFASVGDSELSLEPDGLYAMSSTIGKITPHQLELPAKLDVGTSWTSETKLEEANGISLEQKATNKVVKMEKVSTKAGDYDALLVESSGPAKINGESMEMRTKAWFVKGLGAVKMEIVQTPKTGPKQTITIQATK
jgi:hypothetical protein